MTKNRLFKVIPMLVILSLSIVLVACGKKEEVASNNPMEYVSIEQLKKSIDETKEYVILDVRKIEDYKKSHIKGAFEADVDAANKGGDDKAGIASLEDGLLEATGSKTGKADAKYALICYSGKTYAQKATDLLIGMGVSKDKIFTLKGGMKAWEAGGSEYTDLLEK
ncbi:Rhodanese-related sulfurtransferase [Hathewaya proteolytica DSM 3090]|uniref:Rhodanese-related sulfurtransferase n=1 Tax=Hathewaya proteolytica DSM 3090 TaxID=1121331 RepID=A0A1M6KH46_9CLOT|nr:rhodanese-like domain-containing protein [Hathewaya proteolytica]SHJ58231.1 Rhodanese-related sulfurtransferase [Hathewaya proteolytica DSM 3090]